MAIALEHIPKLVQILQASSAGGQPSKVESMVSAM
jgi:hypothetical protein